MTAHAKYLKLKQVLHSLDRVLVAFSGGVDSTFLLAVAREVLGSEAVLGVTGVSSAQPSGEKERSVELAARLGVRHRLVETGELSHPAFVRNPPDRCYHCKKVLFTTMLELAHAEGLAAVAEGSNADDALHDYRPGLRAIRELGIHSPLLEVGLTKPEIRELSRELELPTWNHPALACLASRIPYGESITPERLRRIDQAEQALLALKLEQVRVRDHNQVARIEIRPDQFARLLEPTTRAQVLEALKAVGYLYVTLDLQGYRTGSLNEGLVPQTRNSIRDQGSSSPAGATVNSPGREPGE